MHESHWGKNKKKKERFVLQKKKNTCTQRLGSEGAFVPGPHARRRFSSGDSAQSSQIDRSIFITALDTKTDVFLSPLKGPCKMIPSPFPANCTPDLEEERSFVHFLPLFFLSPLIALMWNYRLTQTNDVAQIKNNYQNSVCSQCVRALA